MYKSFRSLELFYILVILVMFFVVLCHSIKCGCIRAFTHLMIIKVMAQAWPVSHLPLPSCIICCCCCHHSIAAKS